MLKLPKTFNPEVAATFIKSIDSNAVDFYQWGLNCRLLVLDDAVQAECALAETAGLTSVQSDDFWEGFYYGIEGLIEVHPELIGDCFDKAVAEFEQHENYLAADAGGGF
jgi:hypothetical protein